MGMGQDDAHIKIVSQDDCLYGTCSRHDLCI